MLTDVDRELIAAAIDGDLPAADEARFRRLLAESVEAGALFRQLQAQARLLSSLPRLSAPASLADTVLDRIRRHPTTVPSSVPRSPRRAAWLPYAVAASALVAVSAASFWLTRHGGTDAGEYAAREPFPRTLDRNAGALAGSPAHPPDSSPESIPSPRPAGPGRAAQEFAAITPEPAPLPRPGGAGDVVGSGLLTEPRPFEAVQLRLPFLAQVPELDRADVRARLLDELGRDPAYRLDLFAKDLHAAAETFQAAAKAVGLKLTVEAVAAERIKQKAMPVAWAVYTESLTPEGAVQFLAQLAARNRADKAAPFTTAHLFPAQAVDYRDARDAFGNVRPWKRPDDITSGTADQVAAAIHKAGKGGQKTALFLTYLPASARVSPKLSREVSLFADNLATRRPDAVPLLIVIRQANP